VVKNLNMPLISKKLLEKNHIFPFFKKCIKVYNFNCFNNIYIGIFFVNNMEIKAKYFFRVFILILILALVSFIISFFSKINFIDSLRILFGFLYVLFLPGFVLSYVFFPKSKKYYKEIDEDKNSIDFIERISLSFALSVAIVPLVIFYFNLFGVKINFVNSFLIISIIISLSIAALYFRYKKSKNYFD